MEVRFEFEQFGGGLLTINDLAEQPECRGLGEVSAA